MAKIEATQESPTDVVSDATAAALADVTLETKTAGLGRGLQSERPSSVTSSASGRDSGVPSKLQVQFFFLLVEVANGWWNGF